MAIALTLGVGCASAPEPAAAEAWLGALLEASAEGATAAQANAAPLVVDARFTSADTEVQGRETALLALQEAKPERAGPALAHHDFSFFPMLFDNDPGWLFAEFDADGKARDILLLTPGCDISQDESTRTTVLDAYQAAWQTEGEARAGHLAASFATAGRYVDPGVDANSREELSSAITDFKESVPGGEIVAGNEDACMQAGPYVLFLWKMQIAGVTVMDGFDVVRFARGDSSADESAASPPSEDLLLELVVGFFEPVPDPQSGR